MEPSTSTLILAELVDLNETIAGASLLIVISLGLMLGLSITENA